MTFEQFREALRRLDLSLVDLAELVDVSPRTVSRWAMEGSDEIPGPVSAYLELMLKLRPEDRIAEIGRLTNRGIAMHNGMYLLAFSGIAGFGNGNLVFENGKVFGYDTGGVQYDGSYSIGDDRKHAVIKVRVTAPPGGELVTGAILQRGAMFDIAVTVPAFSKDAHAVVTTPYGQVTVRLQYLRGLAAA